MRVDLNRTVATALGSGVALSLLILIWGSVLYLRHPSAPPSPPTISGILRGTVHLNPAATINLGLFVLLITPVARVIAALTAFALEHDKRYVLISLAVLAVLALAGVFKR